MSKPAQSIELDQDVRLLVKHYGLERVRASIARIAKDCRSGSGVEHNRTVVASRNGTKATIVDDLENLKGKDAEKYRILCLFYADLKAGKILSASQDVRFFSQMIGLKKMRGRSRRDLIPQLVRAMLIRQTGQIRDDLEKASSISEKVRQQGFSVLTAKLLSGQ